MPVPIITNPDQPYRMVYFYEYIIDRRRTSPDYLLNVENLFHQENTIEFYECYISDLEIQYEIYFEFELSRVILTNRLLIENVKLLEDKGNYTKKYISN